ncbi:hypothetical protein DUNSADRAFT_13039, partial [Dunaliella salina]
VIVDETSMVDLVLMSEVIKAQGEGSRLILVGDVEQLPPVSIGAPFQDLVAWNKLPAVYLDQVRTARSRPINSEVTLPWLMLPHSQNVQRCCLIPQMLTDAASFPKCSVTAAA